MWPAPSVRSSGGLDRQARQWTASGRLARPRRPPAVPDLRQCERRADLQVRVETELDSGLYLEPDGPRMLLADWVRTWCATHVTGRARTANLDVMFRVHLLPVLGQVPLGRITPLSCQALIRAKIDQGKSAATVHKIAQALKQVLGAAVRNDLIPRNPADGLVLPRMSVDVRMFLSQDQLDHLLEVCRLALPQWHALVHTTAYTGLRWGEVTALRREDVDLLRRRLHVAQSAVEVRGHLTYGRRRARTPAGPSPSTRRPAWSWPSTSNTCTGWSSQVLAVRPRSAACSGRASGCRWSSGPDSRGSDSMTCATRTSAC